MPDHSTVLRGSSLFLVGRVMAMAIALCTQVLVVRYLGKADYGTFAYAIAFAAVIQSVLPLGLDRADTRFLALYDEKGDYHRLLGVVATEGSVILGAGVVVLAAIFFGGGLGSGPSGGGHDASTVMLILVCVAPLAALDAMVLNVFAVFARPGAVFFRRYVLDPLLRLTVVIVLITAKMTLVDLALGYLLAGLVGTLLYIYLVLRLLRGVLSRAAASVRVSWPGRELIAFALPLLTAAVAYSATVALPAVVLGHLGSATDVAELRAVQPLAGLIVVVPTVFATLFTPQAARLFVRGDGAQLRKQYWSTAAWVSVLAFPVVILLVNFSGLLTRILFGSRYEAAAPMLVVLGVAFYLSASFGLNGSVLQVVGRLKSLTVANVAGLVSALVVSFATIPFLHGLGAAVAVAVAVVVPQILKQWAMGATPVGRSSAAARRLWVVAAAVLAGGWLLTRVWAPNVIEAALVTIAGSAVLVAAMHRWLQVAAVFPVAGSAYRRMQRVAVLGPGVRALAGALRRGVIHPPASLSDPGQPEPRPAAAAEVGHRSGTQGWHDLDWRFLLPDPHLGKVWVAPGNPEEAETLRSIGVSVARWLDGSVRFAFVRSSDIDLDELQKKLPPGASVRILIDGPPPGSRPWASLRRWTAWRRTLEARDWAVPVAVWAAPSSSQPRAYAPIDDIPALRFVAMVAPASRKGQLQSALLRLAVRLGLREVVCREGVIVARTPS